MRQVFVKTKNSSCDEWMPRCLKGHTHTHLRMQGHFSMIPLCGSLPAAALRCSYKERSHKLVMFVICHSLVNNLIQHLILERNFSQYFPNFLWSRRAKENQLVGLLKLLRLREPLSRKVLCEKTKAPRWVFFFCFPQICECI